MSPDPSGDGPRGDVGVDKAEAEKCSVDYVATYPPALRSRSLHTGTPLVHSIKPLHEFDMVPMPQLAPFRTPCTLPVAVGTASIVKNNRTSCGPPVVLGTTPVAPQVCADYLNSQNGRSVCITPEKRILSVFPPVDKLISGILHTNDPYPDPSILVAALSCGAIPTTPVPLAILTDTDAAVSGSLGSDGIDDSSKPEVVLGVPPTHWVYEDLPDQKVMREMLGSMRSFRAGSSSPRQVYEACIQFLRNRNCDVPPDCTAPEQVDADGDVFVESTGAAEVSDPPSLPSKPIPDEFLQELLASNTLRAWDPTMGDPCILHSIHAIKKPGSDKFRFIDDLTPIGSLFPPTPSFHMPRAVFPLHGGKKFACKIDMRSAYWLIRVSKCMWHHFAVRDKSQNIFVMPVLPQGFNWSAFLFDATLRPVDAALRAVGVDCVRFADDLLLLADSPQQLATDLILTMQLLLQCGSGDITCEALRCRRVSHRLPGRHLESDLAHADMDSTKGGVPRLPPCPDR